MADLAPTSSAPFEIRPFQPGDAAAFSALNEAWISKHFGMEERDHINLGNPEGTILAVGGHILMAYDGSRPVGCCALIPEHHPDSPGATQFELAKMAVAEDIRGRGLGRRILLETIALARTLGARRLTLGSNRKLAEAVHLYESVGFHHLAPERRPATLYARANVFMEMNL